MRYPKEALVFRYIGAHGRHFRKDTIVEFHEPSWVGGSVRARPAFSPRGRIAYGVPTDDLEPLTDGARDLISNLPCGGVWKNGDTMSVTIQDWSNR